MNLRKSIQFVSLMLLMGSVLFLAACAKSPSTAAATSTAGWEYRLEQPFEDNPNRGIGEVLLGKAPGTYEFVEIYKSDIGSDDMEFLVSEDKVYVCYDTYLYAMGPDGGNCKRIYKPCGGMLALYDGYLYTTELVKNSIGGSYPYLIRISLTSYDVEETDIPVRTFSVVDGGYLNITTDKNRTSFESGEHRIEDLPWE